MAANIANTTVLAWDRAAGRWQVFTVPAAAFREWRPSAVTLPAALAALRWGDPVIGPTGTPAQYAVYEQYQIGLSWSATAGAWVTALGTVTSHAGMVMIADRPSFGEALDAAIAAAVA